MTGISVEGRRAPSSLRLLLVAAGLLGALAISGCGGGKADSRQEDRVAIERLVERINAAVADSDPAGWCAAYSPESITETFGSPARCRRETAEVIAGSDSGRRLRIEGIAYQGDDGARVAFEGAAGEANLTRIDGSWYLDLLQEVDAEPVPQAGTGGAG